MSTEKYKLFDDLLSGVVVIDNNQSIVYFNQAFLVLIQSSPRVLKNTKQFSELFDKKEVITKVFEGAQKNTTGISEESILFTTQGYGPITVVIKAIKEEDNIILSFNDLTVERNLYDKYKIQLEEIKKTHEKILQTDKLATLGELSAGISHEINNPLTVAYGYAQNIEWELKENASLNKEEVITSINRVTTSLEKISSIINNMKSYVRTNDDHRQFCDLQKVTKGACELTHTGSRKDLIKMEINEIDEPLIIQANPVELEQVIVNLLKNSFDALLDNQVKNPSVTISFTKADHFVGFSITDNGPGIDSSIGDNVFQPFFTTKDIGKGSGLGLSISKRLIEKHQGTLTFENQKQGVCFSIQLPTMEMSSMITSGGFGPEIGEGDQKKILIVDNDPAVLNELDEMLQAAGYSVVGSTGGDDALHILIQTEIDLVITDLAMPKFSGSELAQKIRALEEDIPIIYLSGALNGKETFQKDKETLNISTFITKPFNNSQVLEAISKVLGASNE
ncbi:MAG: hypothetical protein COW01_09340 [Bdellovibrionales bacterium CG12_big_fil_rev_8_21_14_0_65_38_15]|nr:MAG: hypothetical protein COW79_09345 [Bdellovibrionales bacterium CG22_combo_CG10-13_8_21_14_all_38_13]PIQ54731.1 MAG: hypothetical protein COW01_09340 [Bdellovibrionales bacterium CG12_big_fil_rev_8_21_14_0_65_38_15]PIR30879.1 MAG: hypothetical protein COV38_03525 [Bdellovibrionales bacterium CG11_big_fil_rev_8_21_14_0_20_38_13]